MLLGTYTHTVDSKGRVFLPAKWRAELGETVIISQATTDIRRGIGLELMSLEAYDIRKRNLINVSDDNIEATNLKREIMYTTSDCDIDKQGRILIPQLLREIAKINEEVILVGMHQSVEIWGTEMWNSFYNGLKNDPTAWNTGITATAKENK